MKPRHVPIRMCVVCRQTSEKKTLLRVIRRPEKVGGGVVPDPTGKASGRGAYVCASAACIDKAIKQKRFERSLSVNSVPETLGAELRAEAEHTSASAVSTGVNAL